MYLIGQITTMALLIISSVNLSKKKPIIEHNSYKLKIKNSNNQFKRANDSIDQSIYHGNYKTFNTYKLLVDSIQEKNLPMDYSEQPFKKSGIRQLVFKSTSFPLEYSRKDTFEFPPLVKGGQLKVSSKRSKYDLKYLGDESGLLSPYLYALTIDSRDLIWTGGYNGASSYDGVNFRHYTKSNGLISNLVSDIMEDENGNIWFASYSGITIFDGFSFMYLRENEGLIGNKVHQIFQDSVGKIWICTDKGISKIEDNSIENIIIKSNSSDINRKIYSVTEGEKGEFFFGSSEGLLRFKDGKFDQLFDDKTETNKSIPTVFFDSNKTLWVSKKGAFYSLSDNNLKKYSFNKDNFYVERITENQDNGIWFSVKNYGILNYENGLFRSLSGSDGIVNTDIWDIIFDTSGAMWFVSDGGGLSRLDDKSFNFLIVNKNLETKNTLDYSAMLIDKKENFWIGSYIEGLKIIQKNKIYEITYPDKEYEIRINDIFEDNQGSIWVTYAGKIEKYSGNKVSVYRNSELNFSDIIEQEDGKIAIGSSRGIFSFEGYNIHKPPTISYKNYSIHNLFKHSSGGYYAGTNSGVLKIGNHTNNRLNHLETLNSEDIHAIYEDSKNRIWIGTKESGIYIWDGKELTNYDESHGISNNCIWTIIEDQQENIWLSTEKGISQISQKESSDLNDFEIKSYGIKEGLSELSFFNGDVIQDSIGVLYWSSSENITVRKPFIKQRVSGDSPSISLNSVHVDYSPLNNSKKTSDSIKGVSYDSFQKFTNIPMNLNLGYRKNQIKLEYRIVDWYSPQSVKFSYRINTSKWSVPSYENYINLHNLPPDDYKVEAVGIGQDGQRSEISNYKFTINPPWWRTKTAYLIYLGFITFAVWGLFKLRLRSLKRKKEELKHLVDISTQEIKKQNNMILAQKEGLEKLNQQKTTMFSVIAHDLRSPINHLKMGLNILSNKEVNEKDKNFIISTLQDDYANTYTLLNNLLNWALSDKGEMSYKPKNESLFKVIEKNIRLFSREAERKKVKLIFRNNETCFSFFDSNMIDTVIRNLLANSLKYTEENGSITVDLKARNEKENLIVITDTGSGMTKDVINKIFDKKYSLANPQNIENGTGLGLELCKSLIEKNKGTIEVLSTQNIGTQISFTLPVGSKNLV